MLTSCRGLHIPTRTAVALAHNACGSIEHSHFDEPCVICFEGHTAYVVMFGRTFGCSILRCSWFDLLKKYCFNLALLHEWVGYTDPCAKKFQLASWVRGSLGSDQKKVKPAIDFFCELTDGREEDLGGSYGYL